ncbi:hypothetical protein COB72_08690 [bacterium]|nr:MAG: hypothetical protein COB72_08690 [bacterium]
MSQLNTPQGKLSPDDRYELAARAQNQQRLNYPKHLIGLGLLLVVVSLVVLVISWQVRSAAQEANTRVAYELTQIEQLITDIQTLEATQATSQDRDRGQPIPDMLSKFKRYGIQAKLENDIGLPKNPKSRPEGNARLMSYPYTLRDPSLEHLLDWVRISIDQTPGLGVTSMEIKPAKQDWTMTITLSRYERNQ